MLRIIFIYLLSFVFFKEIQMIIEINFPVFYMTQEKKFLVLLIIITVIAPILLSYLGYRSVIRSEKIGALNSLTKKRRFFDSHYHERKVINNASLCYRGKVYVAIIELDDQGLFYNRNDFLKFKDFFDKNSGNPKIVITFTHGWNHNCAHGDSNLERFRQTLINTYDNLEEKKMVIGVYIAWQGNSYKIFSNRTIRIFPILSKIDQLNLFSFWNRQERILTISQGSMQEIMDYINLKKNPRTDVTAHVGHSFGGFLLYYCRSHAIMNYIITDKAPPEDIILCLNPAFSAIRFLPLFDAAANTEIQRKFSTPIFVSITSKADIYTKFFFVVGNFLALFLQGFTNKIQRKCLYSTIGHREEIITHEIIIDKDQFETKAVSNFSKIVDYKNCSKNIFSSGIMNITCKENFINGHNDVFNENVQKYIFDLISFKITKQASDASLKE